MNAFEVKQRIYRLVGPTLGTLIALLVCLERIQVYAQSLNGADAEVLINLEQQSRKAIPEIRRDDGSPVRQLGELPLEEFKKIKTREQACKRFEGRLIAYYDVTGLVKGCRLRIITDPLMLNLLREQNVQQITEIPSFVYRLLPHGEPIVESDIKDFEKSLGFKIRGNICSVLQDTYVTASGVNFYFVEDCKKRIFADYASLEEHNVTKKTVKTITPGQLASLADGEPMQRLSGGINDLWVKIDGDAGWQRSLRMTGDRVKAHDDPAAFRKAAEKQLAPVNKSKLCKELRGQLVSFYGHIYFVDGCTLREVQEPGLDTQVYIEKQEGIRDLTSAEKRSLEEGEALSEEEALRKLR